MTTTLSTDIQGSFESSNFSATDFSTTSDFDDGFPTSGFSGYPSGGVVASHVSSVAILLISGFFGSIGNFIVVVVYGGKQSKTVSDCLIFSLAIVDLFTSVVYLPMAIYFLFVMPMETWQCWLDNVAPVLLVFTPLLILLAITIDRYIAVCLAHRYRMICTPIRARIFVVIAVIISFCVSLPLGFDCGSRQQPITAIFRIVYLATIIVISLVMSVVYGIIFSKLHHQKKLRDSMRGKSSDRDRYTARVTLELSSRRRMSADDETGVTNMNNGNGSSPEASVSLTNESNSLVLSGKTGAAAGADPNAKKADKKSSFKIRIRLSQERRTAMMLLLVTSVFVVLYLPGAFLMVTVDDFGTMESNYPGLLGTVVPMFFLNLPANPVIYTIMSSRFRKDSQAVFRRWENRLCRFYRH